MAACFFTIVVPIVAHLVGTHVEFLRGQISTLARTKLTYELVVNKNSSTSWLKVDGSSRVLAGAEYIKTVLGALVQFQGGIADVVAVCLVVVMGGLPATKWRL